MTVNMDKEAADREAPDPIANASEDAAVQQLFEEVKPIASALERTDKEHSLVRYDKGAITKFVRGLSSKQAVIARVREANHRRKDAEVTLKAAESAASAALVVACNHRVELGRALIEARKLFPTSGPKAKGWIELLESEGLPRTTALNYMTLAGYVAEVPTARRENLTYRKIGIKRDKAAPSLMERLTSVLADLEGPLNEATDEERKACVSKLEEWLEAYR